MHNKYVFFKTRIHRRIAYILLGSNPLPKNGLHNTAVNLCLRTYVRGLIAENRIELKLCLWACLQAKLIPGCTIFVSMNMRCSMYIVVSMNMFCAIAFYIVSPLESLLKPIHNFWNFGIPKSALRLEQIAKYLLPCYSTSYL